MASNLGKRYRCPECGTEILCAKAGEGSLTCCGEPMVEKEMPTMESSD
jgi:desulfoferrodoxin-like iron-binding protein